MSGTNATTAAPAPHRQPRENRSKFARNARRKNPSFSEGVRNGRTSYSQRAIALRLGRCSALDVGCWTLGWFPTTRLAHPFHHCFRPTVADDFHALAFVNQLSLRNHIEDFIAELGLAPGPQLRNGDPHLPEARHLFSLELRSRDDSTGRLRNQFSVKRSLREPAAQHQHCHCSAEDSDEQ